MNFHLVKLELIFSTFFILAACAEKHESVSSQSGNQIEGYELVWSDEFESTMLDTDKWEFQIGDGTRYGLPAGWGNSELQWYTQTNYEVRNGNLAIIAKQENQAGLRFTSARMRTLGKGDWKYGRYEIRAKLPRGRGIWPAIWMLPTNSKYGGWAASGEIDIMEMIAHENDKVYGTLHYGGEWPDNVHHGTSFKLAEGDFSSDFHVFVLEWEKGEIRWFVDGIHYQTLNEWYSTGNQYPAPFDQQFHVILNVAVGGNWPGNPDSSTVFPQEMLVDYVRVYKKINR